MEKVKNLYPDTPPTALRKRDEKFRTAKNSRFWHSIGNFVFFKMMEKRFFSMMMKNEENLEKIDKNFATICYTPHTNWWDGNTAYNLCHRLKTGKFRLMIEEMNRFPLFQYVGCFPINKKTAQTAMEALKYSAQMLKDPEVNFWIFPQGIIRPPCCRPIKFQSGLAHIVQNAVKSHGGINLVPVAVKYAFLREDKPEVLVEFGDPMTITIPDFERKEFTKKIQTEFEILCDNQDRDVSAGNLEGYSYLFKQKLSWWKQIEKKLKNIGMPRENRVPV